MANLWILQTLYRCLIGKFSIPISVLRKNLIRENSIKAMNIVHKNRSAFTKPLVAQAKTFVYINPRRKTK